MKVAVLIDLAFAVKRYKALIEKPSGKIHSPEDVAKCLWDTSIKHVRSGKKDRNELYRILCYDCPPFEGNSQNPITRKNVNFSKTDQAKWRNELHASLLQMRSVAIRRGVLSPGGWFIPEMETKHFLKGIDFVLDPLWHGISLILAEHIDAMNTYWPKPKKYTK